MKRLRLYLLSRQLLTPRPIPRHCCIHIQPRPCQGQNLGNRRWQSSEASQLIYDENIIDEGPISHQPFPEKRREYTSPPPEAALHSAKLAALHARLSLPEKIPLQTLARALIDPSADTDVRFNNFSLAQVGGSIISYHVSEWLLVTYPRLPMTVLFSATYAYNGPPTLTLIAKEWGVETAAFPGPEVNPGLLQFSKLPSGAPIPSGGAITREGKRLHLQRRGISSRNVYDDEFGDVLPKEDTKDLPQAAETAHANLVKAIVGAIYLHAGRTAAKKFVQEHILSRHLEIGTLFAFKEPVRELARLCAREEFETPVARILSETGRHSRTPVYVVGIYSGENKLGEGSAANLREARLRASVAALKAWYLYSPGRNQRVPSEMEDRDAEEWDGVYIDMGEIIH